MLLFTDADIFASALRLFDCHFYLLFHVSFLRFALMLMLFFFAPFISFDRC